MDEAKKMALQSTYKSEDTEEWLDIHFNRPVGYAWALFFNRFNIHPNVVTIFSIILGVAAGVMFYFPDLLHNIAGVLLLMWANFYDSCDGQLARMTGKKTHWGRMLDGFAGDVWFVVIYGAICLRLYDENIPFTNIPWNLWIFFFAFVSGIILHSRQCKLADYYRNIHMYFLGGKNNELDTSSQQLELYNNTLKKGNFWWRRFLYAYVGYTRSQEKMTPELQRLFHYIKRGGQDIVTDEFRRDFRKKSLPLMTYANILTFNCRAIALYVSCLLNIPWLYFLIEISVFSFLAVYMHYRHEKMCHELLKRLQKGCYSK